MLDNTGVGTQVLSIAIGSLQAGETAAIYTGSNSAALSLFTSVTGLPDTQTIDLTSANATFVGVVGVSVNSVLVQEVVASNVSEPASMALLGCRTLWDRNHPPSNVATKLMCPFRLQSRESFRFARAIECLTRVARLGKVLMQGGAHKVEPPISDRVENNV